MIETIIAEFRAKTAYRGQGYRRGSTIHVSAKLYQLDGNARAHFSVTGEIREPGRREPSAMGCIHDDILRHWPELAPVVALDLSDDTGAPMHAFANGWYWMAGLLGGAGQRYHGGNREPYGKENDCRAILASHLRLSLSAVDALAMECSAAAAADDADGAQDWNKAKEHFARFVDQQAERWHAEANAALALIRSLS